MKPGCLARPYEAGPLPAAVYEYERWELLAGVKRLVLIEGNRVACLSTLRHFDSFAFSIRTG